MKRYFILLTILLNSFLITNQSNAQGYKLDFKIEGIKDTTFYLGNYFGESTYVKDTARANTIGEFTFAGKKTLDEGMYFLVLNKTRLFDFVVGKDQEFEIQTSTEDYIKNIKIEGDVENELFHEDILFNIEQNNIAEAHVKILRDSTSSPELVEKAKNMLDLLNDKVLAHQNEIIKKNPEYLLSRIFLVNRRTEVPETPNGRDSKEFGYWYLRNHYWDNLDLSDAAFLRISRPLFKEKVEDYLDRLIVQHPDSITAELNKMIQIAKQNRDTYKYLVWTCTIKYQNPEIMGLDEVFVNLYDTYFATGEMDFWANKQLKKNLKERAEQLRLSLIGKTAPNMIMMDQYGKMQSLYGIKNKYTLIYFFDPDCGHCKKETPLLKSFYEEKKFDVQVFAVSADTSMVKMKKYIKDMNMTWITVNGPRTATGTYHDAYDASTTPTLYVLDEKKKIIAKKLPAARLEDFLTQYENIQNKKSGKP